MATPWRAWSPFSTGTVDLGDAGILSRTLVDCGAATLCNSNMRYDPVAADLFFIPRSTLPDAWWGGLAFVTAGGGPASPSSSFDLLLWSGVPATDPLLTMGA